MLYIRKAVMLVIALLAQQGNDKNFKLVDELTGSNTPVERSFAAMAATEKEWLDLWQEHRQNFGDMTTSVNVLVDDSRPPKIDFKKNIVIVYFGGQSRGIDGYDVYKVDTKGKTNVVQIVPRMMENVGVVTNSYGFWVFPRPKRAVELEILTQVVDGQPKFRKVAKFEPPKN